jgi:ribosomal protein S11
MKRRNRKFLFISKLMRKYKRMQRRTRTAIMHFKSFDTNYYITLTDLSYNVIFSCSAGSVSSSNNKKTKISTVTCMPMFLRILVFLKSFRIRNLKFEVKNGFDKHFYNAIEFFIKKRFKIKTISAVSRAAHHFGQRTNKPRRI